MDEAEHIYPAGWMVVEYWRARTIAACCRASEILDAGQSCEIARKVRLVQQIGIVQDRRSNCGQRLIGDRAARIGKRRLPRGADLGSRLLIRNGFAARFCGRVQPAPVEAGALADAAAGGQPAMSAGRLSPDANPAPSSIAVPSKPSCCGPEPSVAPINK
ncbi:MAG: hypothetical protein J0I42_20505 [Bosea sp.]|uniref:hypothetical protein n=1 Tax=Bosea sp. (in: a-proteobacteria) TaxID=1871050 RepID=UPI001AD5E40A|nr:hypothetical protein [Bosea sp. (in: a-proteobacteria)]MBN9454325.1 hypothetical protein [Bosea sp. (in: a-proteobacteria)]